MILDDRSIIDKLRDELFNYRVDIKSYIKNLNTIMISGTVLIALLAFFGYNRIDSIEKTILEEANKRLAVTDSILAKIDQSKIDSLNTFLIIKEKELIQTISNFEKIIYQNKSLEMKLLNSLPENDRINRKEGGYIDGLLADYVEMKPFKTILNEKEIVYIYLVLKENVEFASDDYISLAIYPKGRGVLLDYKYYNVNSKLNKISFGLRKFKNYKDYRIEVAYFKKENKDTYRRYYTSQNIELK